MKNNRSELIQYFRKCDYSGGYSGACGRWEDSVSIRANINKGLFLKIVKSGKWTGGTIPHTTTREHIGDWKDYFGEFPKEFTGIEGQLFIEGRKISISFPHDGGYTILPLHKEKVKIERKNMCCACEKTVFNKHNTYVVKGGWKGLFCLKCDKSIKNFNYEDRHKKIREISGKDSVWLYQHTNWTNPTFIEFSTITGKRLVPYTGYHINNSRPEHKGKLVSYTKSDGCSRIPKICYIDKDGNFHDCEVNHRGHDKYIESMGIYYIDEWEEFNNTIKYSDSISGWVRGHSGKMSKKQCNTLMEVLIESDAHCLPEYIGLRGLHPYLEDWMFDLYMLDRLVKNHPDKNISSDEIKDMFYSSLKF